MLPERVTELLSAYVDGELSLRERKNVTRLLRKSGEARQMLHKLKQDSMILRKMPRRKTQMDLSGSVMGTITLRGITLPKIEAVPLPPAPAPKRRWPIWAALTVGGLLLVAVGAASYYISVAAIRKSQGGGSDNTPPGPGTGQTNRSPAIPDKPLPIIGLMHEPEMPEPPRPGVDPKKDDRYGLGWTKPPAFVVPHPRLTLIQSVRDLDEPVVGQKLLNELRKDETLRIDLFCSDTTPALDCLQATCKLFGANLRLDAYAQARLKQKTRTNFAIYSRDLTPQEWTLLLQHLAGEEKRSTAKLFDKLTVNGLTTAELAKVLGGEPTNYERPPVDLTQDIAAQTGTDLAKSLSGQNPKADPEAGGLTRQAVAIPYLPQPGFSREVRYIVEGKSWRPGAVQVLLVLWNP